MKLDARQIQRIRDLYKETGDKTKVANLTGHSRGTVIRYTNDKLKKVQAGDLLTARILNEANRRAEDTTAVQSTGSLTLPRSLYGRWEFEPEISGYDRGGYNPGFPPANPDAYHGGVPYSWSPPSYVVPLDGKEIVRMAEKKEKTLPRRISHRETFQLPNYKKIAFVSCTHHPYQDKAAVGAVLNYIAANAFDLVVLAGDQCDFYNISRFSKDPRRVEKIQEEINETKRFVQNVNSLKTAVVWMDGNHDDRMRRFVDEKGLGKLDALEMPNLFGLPEHWAYAENQAHIRVGSLLMCHGDLAGRGSGTRHVAQGMFDKLTTSVLFGHFHRFDRYYHTDYDRVQRAAFACGHLCDESAADYVRSPGWQSGFCEVEYNHDENLFSVRDHVITKGKFYANGRIWS